MALSPVWTMSVLESRPNAAWTKPYGCGGVNSAASRIGSGWSCMAETMVNGQWAMVNGKLTAIGAPDACDEE
jgi:hypothetical protein